MLHSTAGQFVHDGDCILKDIVRKGNVDYSGEPKEAGQAIEAFHRAGPRSELHFDPNEVMIFVACFCFWRISYFKHRYPGLFVPCLCRFARRL